MRQIINSVHIHHTIYSQKKIEHLLKKYNYLSDINDHRILCEAELLGQEIHDTLYFVTSDGAQLLFAQKMPHLVPIFHNDKKQEEIEYGGWIDYHPTETEMVNLYTNKTNNTLNCKINEYAKIYDGKELKDVLVWTGNEYRNLNYHEIKNKFLGETIKPLNLEQKMAFDLLQNQSVPVKLLIGKPGSGKDYLMLLHALELVQRGAMDKIIFIRNLVPFKDAPEIGFLAGSLEEKIAWGMGPLESILGEAGLEEFQDQGLIEAQNLGFIRGCSWDRTIIYVSEGQNLTAGGYKLLVSRCGKNSQLWINGDLLQTDDKKFETNNGLIRLISSLSGNPLFGVVKLIKTERSKTAELASII